MDATDVIRRSVERDAFAFQSTRHAGRHRETFKALKRTAGRLARRRVSKDHTRDRLMDFADRAMHLAQKEGRGQTLALGGVRHAVLVGGMRGEPLAPTSLYEYVRLGVPPVLDALEENDPEGLDGGAWLSIYRGALEQVSESQRGKLAAFLEAFHRFVVIVGGESLPCSILGQRRMRPPDARIVWPDEIEAAVEYVLQSDAQDCVKRQAVLCLRLAYEVPIRSHELWCIRLIDFNERADPPVLAIAPRRRDGMNKASSSRRQVDLLDRDLIALLLDQKSLRQQQEAIDEDVLLGVPNHPDGRLEELATTQLINASLKAATRDADAALHDLRHGCVSRKVALILEEVDVA